MTPLRERLVSLLRFTEQYTKADMVYVARGGFWISLGQGVASILSLLLVIAFANLLPKETYGLYRYILSIAGVLNIFALVGMNSAVARAVAAGSEGALRTSVRYQLKWNLLMFVAFLAVATYYAVAGNTMFAACFLILGVFVPPTLAFNTYGAYLEGKRDFRLASIFSILSTCIYAAGTLAAIVLGGDMLWLIGAYAASTFLATALFYAVTLRLYRPPKEPAPETLQYGRELTFIGFLEPVAAQIDKIIVAQFWGAAQLAVYSLAQAIPARATSYMKGWVGIGFPKFAAKTPQDINQNFYLRVAQGAAIGAALALAYAAAAPYLFYYVLPQYLDSVFYSQVLAAAFIFAMPNRYVSLLLVSQKLSGAILVTNAVQLVLKILLYVTLGIYGGILGLVLAFVLHAGIGMLINIYIWQRESRRLAAS